VEFALSAEQELLKKEFRNFLDIECPKSMVKKIEGSEAGYSPEIWKKMAELGWLGLSLPEEYGGVGGTLMDLAVLFEEVGRAAFPSPLFSTILMGALPILENGSEQQKKDILPGVVRGEVIMTMALTEPEADYEPRYISTRATQNSRGYSISGTKLFVQFAHVADHMLVVVRTGKAKDRGEGLTIFVVPGRTRGLSLTPLITIASDKQFEVAFRRVSCPAGDILGSLDCGWSGVDATLRKGMAIQCVQMVGVAQKALEMTASYAATRVQFDRPIGSFQAVQHRIADMMTDVEGARWTSYQAVWRLSKSLPVARELAIAKAWTSDACQRVTAGAHHIHGGVGMDLDYDLHYYFRWSKALELNLGAAPVHKKAGEEAIIQDLLAA